MLSKQDWKVAIRPVGIPLIGEGIAMLACIVPALQYNDGTMLSLVVSAFVTILAGFLLLFLLPRRSDSTDNRVSYITVVIVWLVLVAFGMLPFLTTRSASSVTNAFFESMSGFTSTGATIFSDVEQLPQSVLFWRSLSAWIGGFGIILLVLAIVPSLGINKHSLYTAEASGADNTGKTSTSMRTVVRRTLSVYIVLTLFFIALLFFSGMTIWEAVNVTFTNISTCGFSIYGDSIARFTSQQQYIIATSMFVGGINFTLLYNFLTFRWRKIRHKLDQFGFYLFVIVFSIAFVVIALHLYNGMQWQDAARNGVVQTVSVVTTTGSVVDDTNLWWTPVVFLFLVLCVCGGMAGSTTGGVKIMRVLILFRNVRNTLVNRLHPNAVNPVRLNGTPVSHDIITNVMVIFIVYAATMLVGLLMLMVCGVGATESLGAVFGCITSYGPGLGECGGFGSYAAFPMVAKWLCSLLMLLGRLECLTVFILFLPGFWRNK